MIALTSPSFCFPAVGCCCSDLHELTLFFLSTLHSTFYSSPSTLFSCLSCFPRGGGGGFVRYSVLLGLQQPPTAAPADTNQEKASPDDDQDDNAAFLDQTPSSDSSTDSLQSVDIIAANDDQPLPVPMAFLSRGSASWVPHRIEKVENPNFHSCEKPLSRAVSSVVKKRSGMRVRFDIEGDEGEEHAETGLSERQQWKKNRKDGEELEAAILVGDLGVGGRGGEAPRVGLEEFDGPRLLEVWRFCSCWRRLYE